MVRLVPDTEGDADPRLQRTVYKLAVEECVLCDSKLVPWPG